MNFGSAFTFLSLGVSLILGAIVYVLLSPLFQSLAESAMIIFTDVTMYPDNVVTAGIYLFKFVQYSGIVFFFFVSAQFLKSYLQPWTNEYY